MKININADAQYTETEVTIKCSRISDDIEKLLAVIQAMDMKLTGRREGRSYIIEAPDIMYIESTDKRTFIYTADDVYESSMRLYELEDRLPGHDFLRAGKSCIFNINHVQSIESDLDRRLILTMKKNLKVIVSRQYSGAVKEKLEAYK